MHLIRLFCCVAITCLLSITLAHAECVLVSGSLSGSSLFMDMGRVMIDPNTPAGTVVAKRTWPLGEGTTAYRCIGDNSFDAKMVMGVSQDNGNRVWPTNIPGIGLRFSLKIEQSMTLTYADKITLNSGSGSDVSMKKATFTLEIVKTAALSGSGPVAAGQYTSFGNMAAGSSLLTTWMRENSLIIVSPSCQVSNSNKFNIDMGDASLAAFKGVGSTAGGRDFSINLQCSGGIGVAGTRVNMTLDGNMAENTAAAQGVLRNEQKGTHVANGIGVQVLDKTHHPVEFKRATPVATLTSQANQFLSIAYFARFYQYLPEVTSGEVQAHMVFNIDYE